MSDLTKERLVEALASPENLDIARSVGNHVGNVVADLACGAISILPTTGSAVCAALALASRLRREAIEFAVNSIVEEGDPATDADLVRSACAEIFDALAAENMTTVVPPDGVVVVVQL